MLSKSFLTACGWYRYAAAWRRACRVSRFASVITRSTCGRTALALVTVVRTRSCRTTLVVSPRSRARRAEVSRCSLYPPLRCLIPFALLS